MNRGWKGGRGGGKEKWAPDHIPRAKFPKVIVHSHANKSVQKEMWLHGEEIKLGDWEIGGSKPKFS